MSESDTEAGLNLRPDLNEQSQLLLGFLRWGSFLHSTRLRLDSSAKIAAIPKILELA